MYICSDCGAHFDEQTNVSTSYESFYGVDQLIDGCTSYHYQTCPICGSDAIEETELFDVELDNVWESASGIECDYTIYDQDGDRCACDHFHSDEIDLSIIDLKEMVLDQAGYSIHQLAV